MNKRNGEMAVQEREVQQLPDWIVQIRRALQAQIKSDDIEQIMQKQIELAKQGDRHAAKFVLDQMGQLASLKGATLNQVNHHHHYHGEDGENAAAKDGAKQAKETRW